MHHAHRYKLPVRYKQLLHLEHHDKKELYFQKAKVLNNQ